MSTPYQPTEICRSVHVSGRLEVPLVVTKLLAVITPHP